MQESSDILDFSKDVFAAYELLEKAERDLDASADDDVSLEAPMDVAHRIWRRVYDGFLGAKPTTPDDIITQVRCVDEIARRQSAKGHDDDGPARLAENLRGWVQLAE